MNRRTKKRKLRKRYGKNKRKKKKISVIDSYGKGREIRAETEKMRGEKWRELTR